MRESRRNDDEIYLETDRYFCRRSPVRNAGIKILGSKDAKKAYTHTTAAVLRAKESVMTAVTKVRENADDILADAKDINEKRAEEEIVEDAFRK